MPLTAHLAELRNRLITILVTIAIGFALAYSFSETVLRFLTKPLRQHRLIFIAPTEAFFVLLKLSLYVGIFVTLPVTLLQLWRFVAPGLYQHERRYALTFVIASTFLFFLGALFAYYIVVPTGITFLLGYAGGIAEPRITVGNYISFFFKTALGIGAAFELPLVLVLFTRLGVITPRLLRQQRKYAILLIWVVAAILTPPDPFSQVIMAVPLMLLFELSIYLSKLFSPRTGQEVVEGTIHGEKVVS